MSAHQHVSVRLNDRHTPEMLLVKNTNNGDWRFIGGYKKLPPLVARHRI